MTASPKLARSLRLRGTDAERRLWRHLRDRRLAFRRQRPVGHYIVDFICMEHRLIVEVDGGQHEWNADADRLRTGALVASGYRVIRFWNNEGVLQQILQVLGGEEQAAVRTLTPTLSPPGRGGAAVRLRILTTLALEGRGS